MADLGPVTTPQHSDALLARLEQRIGPATAPLLALLAKVRRRLAVLALNPASLVGDPVDRIVDQVLLEMGIAARRAVRAGSSRDVVMEELRHRQRRVTALARDLAGMERPSLARALLMLKQAEHLASGLRGALSDTLVGAQTQERRRIAQRGSQVLMWVPERDACVRCLRYSGLRLLSGKDEFPGGLSYDTASEDRTAAAIPGPPLHPHCRCELQLVRRGDSGPASDALRREADRSILRGFALESEGDAARRRAASQLLSSGVQAPQSVKADARRRLREGGQFGREVPSG